MPSSIKLLSCRSLRLMDLPLSLLKFFQLPWQIVINIYYLLGRRQKPHDCNSFFAVCNCYSRILSYECCHTLLQLAFGLVVIAHNCWQNTLTHTQLGTYSYATFVYLAFSCFSHTPRHIFFANCNFEFAASEPRAASLANWNYVAANVWIVNVFVFVYFLLSQFCQLGRFHALLPLPVFQVFHVAIFTKFHPSVCVCVCALE